MRSAVLLDADGYPRKTAAMLRRLLADRFKLGTRPSDTTRSIVEMLPEQLGLKLEETRGPVETLVIEHAERPPNG